MRSRGTRSDQCSGYLHARILFNEQRMKHPYSNFLTLAGVLAGSIAVAQMPQTITNASRAAAFEAKRTQQVAPASAGVLRGGVANDDCAGATVMTVGETCSPVSASLTGSTESLPAAACSGFTSSAAADVWFSFVATGTTTVVEATGGGDGTTGLDLVLELFGGSCAELGSLGCVDASLRAETESFAFATTVGTTYYYRVYNWVYTAGQDTEEFTTCVYSPTNVPANDLCTGADNQSLAVGASITFSGDNTGALDTELLGAATVWHSFTTTECTNLVINYCGTNPAFGNAFTSLFTDCPPTNAIGAESFNITDCTDGNVTLYFENIPAGTYYYGVLTEDGAVGPYTINVTASACTPPPGNDDCANAMVLTSGATCLQVGFTTDAATQSLPAILCAGFTSPSSLDVWFSFVATSETQTIGVAGFNAADAVIELFSGDCSNLVSLGCADATFPSAADETTTEALTQSGLTVGTTYYARVYDYGHGSDDHMFEICVTEGAGANIGINEVTGSEAWSMYPNPSEGLFNLSWAGKNASGTVEVVDVMGRIVYSQGAQFATGSVRSIDLKGLSAGTYTVRVIAGGERS